MYVRGRYTPEGPADRVRQCAGLACRRLTHAAAHAVGMADGAGRDGTRRLEARRRARDPRLDDTGPVLISRSSPRTRADRVDVGHPRDRVGPARVAACEKSRR